MRSGYPYKQTLLKLMTRYVWHRYRFQNPRHVGFFSRFHLAVQLTFLLTERNFSTKLSRQASVKQLIALSLSFIAFADRNCFPFPRYVRFPEKCAMCFLLTLNFDRDFRAFTRDLGVARGT